MATPKLQGLAKAMAMLEHNLEDGACKLLTKIESVEARGVAAITKGHKKIDGKAALVDEIESYVTALEGSNGGDPLDDSSESSEHTDALTNPPTDTQAATSPADRPPYIS